jgi:soluble lytic murein transglycosylase
MGKVARVRGRTAARLRARGLTALVVMGACLAGSAVAVPEGWFDAVELDAVDAALLERPGAALRHARDSVRAGETARAERLLSAIALQHPVVADVADLERMRLYVLTGRNDEAIALAEGWSHADSPLRAAVHTELGRAYAERGDEEAARAAWLLALDETPGDAARATLLLELARSYHRSGDAASAGERLLEIWTRYPTAPEAEEAEAGLERLEHEGQPPLRAAARTRERGDVLFRERHNEAALAAYERALALGGLDRRAAQRARTQRAHTLFRMRRYSEAAEAYAALPRNAENRIARARSVARAGDPKGAAAELERIASDVRGVDGARARLLAALLWSDEGEEQRAGRLYRSLAAGRSGYATAALWRLGWQAYRQGRFEEAIARFDELGERETHPIANLRSRYWRARAAERAGHEGAAEEFGAIAREFPLSYYGWRASSRAALGTLEAPPPRLLEKPSVLRPRELERARILLEAGLVELAREELDRLYVRVDGLEDRLALAGLYADSGDHHRPQRLVVEAYAVTLARGPGSGPVELWWYAWPLPFQDAVRSATATRHGLPQELVYAVMREESGYRPEVLSVSGARGLLQLMPETAERVAHREDLAPVDADDLFLPDVNIAIGSAYLDELLMRFSGRASAAIGSYNAGPHRVVRWLEQTAGDDDEWVEDIPYDQTRSYVKRVLRSVHAYRVLY